MAASVRSAAMGRIAVLLFLLLAPAGRSLATDDIPTSGADPQISIHEGFVDERTCASCHADQAAAFSKSHHAKAMALANDETVRGDFDNATFDHDGVVTTFTRRDGGFFINTEGRTATRPSSKSNIPSPTSPCSNTSSTSGEDGCRLSTSPGIRSDGSGSGWATAPWLNRARPIIGQVPSIAGTAPASIVIRPIPRRGFNRRRTNTSRPTSPPASAVNPVMVRAPGTSLRRNRAMFRPPSSRIEVCRKSMRASVLPAMPGAPSCWMAINRESPFSIIFPLPCSGRIFISRTDRSSTRSSNMARFSKARWQGPV